MSGERQPFESRDILETKISLGGTRQIFRCLLMHDRPGYRVLLFVSDAPRRIDDLILPAGTVTIAHFWLHRTYNVYHWLTPDGLTIAHYFNLVGTTTMDRDTLTFEDWEVDLLLRPGDPEPRVLDWDQVPSDIPPSLRSQIERNAKVLAEESAAVAVECSALSRVLWPRVQEALMAKKQENVSS